MRRFWDVYWHVARATYKDRAFAVGRVVADDLCRATGDTLRASWGTMDDVYRVLVPDDNKRVEVVCLGITSVDSEAEGIYTDSTQLPMWIQEKLALLTMMRVDPPQTKVDGVGMRVDENVYWVIKG